MALKERDCIAWRTKRPYLHRDKTRDSPVFSLRNSEWSLSISCLKNKPCVEMYFKICLVNKSGLNNLQPFHVMTYLEDSRCSGPISPQRVLLTSTGQAVWYLKYSDLLREIPKFTTHGVFTIVCSFDFTIEAGAETSASDITSGQLQILPATSVDHRLRSSVDHLESLSQDLSRLLDDHTFSDLKLRTGRYIIPVHKVVLAARSGVFLAMFQNETEGNSSGVVDIQDMDYPVLHEFVKYLYSGKLREGLREDMVIKLYTASLKYAVRSLTKTCSGLIRGKLGEENFQKILVLAHTYTDKVMEEAAVNFIAEHDSLLGRDSWIAFSKENPRLALEVYRVWFNKSFSNRNQSIS